LSFSARQSTSGPISSSVAASLRTASAPPTAPPGDASSPAESMMRARSRARWNLPVPARPLLKIRYLLLRDQRSPLKRSEVPSQYIGHPSGGPRKRKDPTRARAVARRGDTHGGRGTRSDHPPLSAAPPWISQIGLHWPMQTKLTDPTVRGRACVAWGGALLPEEEHVAVHVARPEHLLGREGVSVQ